MRNITEGILCCPFLREIISTFILNQIRGNNLTRGQMHGNPFPDFFGFYKVKDLRAEGFVISTFRQISLGGALP